MSDDNGYVIARVGLSLPCTVPITPGVDNTDAPIEQRTERCATDAWWVIGRAPICDRHLRRVIGDEEYADICKELATTANETELTPFAEAYRYAQESARPL